MTEYAWVLARMRTFPFRPVHAVAMALLLSAACHAERPPRAPLAEDAGLEVASGWAYPTTQGAGVAFLEILRTEATPDTLLAVEDLGGPGKLMETSAGRMTRLNFLPVPGRGALMMAPGGLHVMFDGLNTEYRIGDSMSLTLRFAQAGSLSVRVPVVSFGTRPE